MSHTARSCLAFSFFTKLLLNLYAYPLFFLLSKRYNIIILQKAGAAMYFQYGETEINYLKRKDKKLAWAIEQIGHIERKLDANLFAAVVRHIVGQQISSKAQATVWARLEARLGSCYDLLRCIAASAEERTGLGMSLRKAEYIKDFADKIVSGEFDLSGSRADE